MRLLNLLGFLSATADPTTTAAGDSYYNSTLKTLRVYDGTAWTSVGGGSGASKTFSFFAG